MYRMKEQDDDFNKQRLEYEREIKHLRLLLRERQEMIDSALGDKRWALLFYICLAAFMRDRERCLMR